MKEFGSDFHYIGNYNSDRTHLTDVFRNSILLADGRQCIVLLIRQYGWRRIWTPDYFCYEVLETIKEQTGIEIVFYEDNPQEEFNVDALPFKEGDVLLRINYFGMRDSRSNKSIPVSVIEDHSHDPFGHWALYSDADWCISSIRKSLPLPEGGMMWSPKGYVLSEILQRSEENEKIAATRWEAMEMKGDYLKGEYVSKAEFRKRFAETEEWFGRAEPSLIDVRTKRFVSKQFDLNLWLGAKRRNWILLKDLLKKENCKVLMPEHESCTMFSFVVLFDNRRARDHARKNLIGNSVYPAILWNVPEYASVCSRSFSERMLSIHCDGRYNEEDIRQLANILNKAIEW